MLLTLGLIKSINGNNTCDYIKILLAIRPDIPECVIDHSQGETSLSITSSLTYLCSFRAYINYILVKKTWKNRWHWFGFVAWVRLRKCSVYFSLKSEVRYPSLVIDRIFFNAKNVPYYLSFHSSSEQWLRSQSVGSKTCEKSNFIFHNVSSCLQP